MARRAQVLEVDAAPESDRLAPFPHPRHTTRLFGHEVAARELADAIASGRCHHAWLLSGPEGIGKATLAWAAATFAVCGGAAEGEAGGPLATARDAPAAAQVRALSYPGLLLIRIPYDLKDKRFRTVITVDEVRRLKGFLSHTVGDGGWRVVIVDTADDMNIAAANALLKSLEEPPPRTLFFLISASPGRLLPTIRSRCRTLQLGALGEADLKGAALAAISASEDAVAADGAALDGLIVEAGGSVRRLLTLAAGAGAGLGPAVSGLFDRLPNVDWTQVHRLADDLAAPANAARYDMFFALLLDRLAGDVRGAVAGGSQPPGALATRAELWETLVREKASADALNLDRKTLVIDAVARLQAATAR